MKKVIRKVCLLGSERVGKTSLVRQYVFQEYSDVYKSTIGVSINKKSLVSKTQETVFMIWDLEGNQDPQNFPAGYIKGAHGAIAVADLSQPDTIIKAIDFAKSFSKMNPSRYCLLAINKVDLFSEEEAMKRMEELFRVDPLAETFSSIMLTSAKTGHNVESLFSILAEEPDE